MCAMPLYRLLGRAGLLRCLRLSAGAAVLVMMALLALSLLLLVLAHCRLGDKLFKDQVITFFVWCSRGLLCCELVISFKELFSK